MANADDIAAVLAGSATWALIEADCLNVLREMPDACVDAVVTDPPAGMAFMQAEWDDFRRARNPNDTGRNSVFGRMSSHGPEYGRDRSWEQPVSEHGFTDGGERLPAPTIGSSRNPMCRTCHKHKRGWKDHPGCQCATPDYDDEHHLGTRDHFIEWLTAIMQECLRVLKPGGHALVWSIPRTSHWTATAIEDSGFEIRDKIAELYSTQDAWQELIGTLGAEQLTMLARALGDDSCVLHIFGSGFPKSLDVSKAIDKAAGAERKVVGYDASRARPNRLYEGGAIGNIGGTGKVSDRTDNGATLTAPATPEAAQWAGFGTALKPACEHWILARKPIERTVAANVLKWGTGAINVDACRVGTQTETHASGARHERNGFIKGFITGTQTEAHEHGRWPANLVLSHTSECRCVGTKRVDGSGHWPEARGQGGLGTAGHAGQDDLDERKAEETVEAWECAPGCPVAELDKQSGERPGCKSPSDATPLSKYRPDQGNYMTQGPIYPDTGGASRFFPAFVPDSEWECAPGCPVAELDKQSGEGQHLQNPDIKYGGSKDFTGCTSYPGSGVVKSRYFDGGGASRFFYTAKAAKSERNLGGIANKHPTVKALDLMRWLCRLVTPPNGIVIDPFAGSGSTIIAALREGFRAIGIERDPEYAATARARIEEDAPLMRRPRPTLEQPVPEASTETEPRQMSLLDSVRKDDAK